MRVTLAGYALIHADRYVTRVITSHDESYSSWIVPEGKTEPERYTVARLVAQRVAD